jgi:hypothetical protein
MLVLVLIAAAGTAVAEPAKGKGFYLVGAAGRSIFDEGSSFFNFGDDEDRSLKFAAGYKFIRFLSVEARYADMGSFSVGFQDFDVSTRSIHVVGIAPFGQSGWEFFGNLGIGKVNLDILGDFNADESTVAGGFGFRWYPTPKFAIGIQTDAYVWDENNDWSSSVGATQLSLQVIF